MSIGRFQPPSDMARVLQVRVSVAEFNAVVEHKTSVVFVPYDSKLAKYLILDERLTSRSGMERMCNWIMWRARLYVIM